MGTTTFGMSTACSLSLLQGKGLSDCAVAGGDWRVRAKEVVAAMGGKNHLTGVCVRGSNPVISTSKAFWHFMQGHVLEVFALLSSLNLYRPALRLAFAEPGRWSARHAFWKTYEALHDSPVLFVPTCAGLDSSWLVLDFLPFTNRSLLRACRLLPALRRAALFRRRPKVRGDRQQLLVFLRRQPSRSRIANSDELSSSLARWAAHRGLAFVDTSFQATPVLDQVDLLLRTDVLVSVHGSGVGAAHFWMRECSTIVEVVPSGWWYCMFSYCGAVSGKMWLLSADPNASRAGLSGSLRSRHQLAELQTVHSSFMQSSPAPGASRRHVVLSSSLLEHLSSTTAPPSGECTGRARAEDLAPSTARAPACDGTALQFWEM